MKNAWICDGNAQSAVMASLGCLLFGFVLIGAFLLLLTSLSFQLWSKSCSGSDDVLVSLVTRLPMSVLPHLRVRLRAIEGLHSGLLLCLELILRGAGRN